MNKNNELELYVEELGKHLFAELSILNEFWKTNLTGRAKEVKVVIMSACSTGNAIHLLSKNPDIFYSETIMLARSFIEKVTNFCYLQICDDKELERFLLHPLYRAFHNGDRSKYAGKHTIGLKYSGKDEMKNIPQMQQALAIFSDTDPRMNWSKLNVDQKVSVIAENTKISPEFFLMNTLVIYSNASEALHGSLYGCALPTGAYIPGEDHKNSEKIKESLLKNTALLYVQMGSLIHETLKIFLDNDEIKSLFESSKKNHELATEIMKLIFVNKKL
jgi:hypothetical protein